MKPEPEKWAWDFSQPTGNLSKQSSRHTKYVAASWIFFPTVSLGKRKREKKIQGMYQFYWNTCCLWNQKKTSPSWNVIFSKDLIRKSSREKSPKWVWHDTSIWYHGDCQIRRGEGERGHTNHTKWEKPRVCRDTLQQSRDVEKGNQEIFSWFTVCYEVAKMHPQVITLLKDRHFL